jgi:hypothetical protein
LCAPLVASICPRLGITLHRPEPEPESESEPAPEFKLSKFADPGKPAAADTTGSHQAGMEAVLPAHVAEAEREAAWQTLQCSPYDCAIDWIGRGATGMQQPVGAVVAGVAADGLRNSTSQLMQYAQLFNRAAGTCIRCGHVIERPQDVPVDG